MGYLCIGLMMVLWIGVGVVSIHAGDKVYKPTWDASTWKRWRTTILRAIASQAHLTEVEPEHWVRDTDAAN